MMKGSFEGQFLQLNVIDSSQLCLSKQFSYGEEWARPSTDSPDPEERHIIKHDPMTSKCRAKGKTKTQNTKPKLSDWLAGDAMRNCSSGDQEIIGGQNRGQKLVLDKI